MGLMGGCSGGCDGCIRSRMPEQGETPNGGAIFELVGRLVGQLVSQLVSHFSVCSRTQKAAFLAERGCSLAVF